ncbi:MAG TPA: PQQ-binding-like beta-propeller repeat protein, partial [Gemmataceae bacterium]|nr:PQQ-binding-like beta-propeller repeat protein [Gemmataceae bacterium]
MRTRAALALTACLLALSARADDWPQFRGPNRDNVSKETGLLKTWPAAGPKLAWTYANLGNGYSGPAVVGDTLYVLGTRDADEFLIALDLTKNPPTEKWPAVKIGPVFTWRGNLWNKGPSSTPTVAGGHVFALGGQGNLVCVTTAGKEVWRKGMVSNLGGQINPIQSPVPEGWGYTWSPLVDGDNVICVPGGPKGMVAALDAKTGNVVWRSKDLKQQATYSSPVISEAGGVRQVVVMTQEGAAGVSAKDGSLLWEYKREEPFGDIVAPTPIVKGDQVLITAGPGGGYDLIKLAKGDSKFTATAVVSDNKVENTHGDVVMVEDHVYGCSGEGRTKWFCINFKTGKVEWTAPTPGNKFGKASLLYADGHFYVLGDKGCVALMEATPAVKFKEVSGFQLPDESKIRPQRGGVWTHPVVANGKLYLRDQELLFCY